MELQRSMFQGCISGTAGGRGTYVSEKLPAYDYDGDNDASRRVPTARSVAGITAAKIKSWWPPQPDHRSRRLRAAAVGAASPTPLLAALDDSAIDAEHVPRPHGRHGTAMPTPPACGRVREAAGEVGITSTLLAATSSRPATATSRARTHASTRSRPQPGSFAPVGSVASIENARNGANGTARCPISALVGVSTCAFQAPR